MNEELRKSLRQQLPIKTRSGSRHLDYIVEVKDDIVILATNPDGTGSSPESLQLLVSSYCPSSGLGGRAGARFDHSGTSPVSASMKAMRSASSSSVRFRTLILGSSHSFGCPPSS